MKISVELLAVSLLALSTVALAAQTNASETKSDKATCCMVANGVVQHTERNIKAIDTAVASLEQAKTSNDPKSMRAAIELAYKSLNEIKQDETKNDKAMKALYSHLTKVEQKAAQLRADQGSLSDLLNGDGLDAQFIIN
ncbi:MAG TPA: hypothetical protein V6D22_13410 [Candidatus Obscuribacterales bacterium]